ncbi:DUF305 domain-containing protein, partial [Streptomyces sp. NPDC001312]|uniref:DUF305 domain-containing protein n=1 Tax=Streptomyces sp. NPDC001312 TaxID=3364561 RepID=UPI0036AA3C3C
VLVLDVLGLSGGAARVRAGRRDGANVACCGTRTRPGRGPPHEHHEGAVERATTEKANGRYASARETADDIMTARNAEIEEMNKLLGKS